MTQEQQEQFDALSILTDYKKKADAYDALSDKFQDIKIKHEYSSGNLTQIKKQYGAIKKALCYFAKEHLDLNSLVRGVHKTKGKADPLSKENTKGLSSEHLETYKTLCIKKPSKIQEDIYIEEDEAPVDTAGESNDRGSDDSEL
jgi:hypothetical protein